MTSLDCCVAEAGSSLTDPAPPLPDSPTAREPPVAVPDSCTNPDGSSSRTSLVEGPVPFTNCSVGWAHNLLRANYSLASGNHLIEFTCQPWHSNAQHTDLFSEHMQRLCCFMSKAELVNVQKLSASCDLAVCTKGCQAVALLAKRSDS